MNEVKKFIVDGQVISVASTETIDSRIDQKVSSWAQEPTKPSYTADEVSGALQESDLKTINGVSIVGSGDIDTNDKKYVPYVDTVDFSSYAQTANIKCTINLIVDGETIQVQSGDVIYAFCNNRCVGYSFCGPVETYLTVRGDSAMSQQPITFKFWKASNNRMYGLAYNSSAIKFSHGFVLTKTMSWSGEIGIAIKLNAGQNYLSVPLNVSGTLTQQTACVDIPWTQGDTIKHSYTRQTGTYNGSNQQFEGNLNSLSPSYMYTVCCATAKTIYFSGTDLTHDQKIFSVYGDGQWSQLPCVFTQTTKFSDAFVNYQGASEGDVIKDIGSFSMFDGENWNGEIDVLQPGNGYLFRRMGSGTTTIDFNID